MDQKKISRVLVAAGAVAMAAGIFLFFIYGPRMASECRTAYPELAGMFWPGLVWLESQEERRAVYCRYLESALRDPRIVGAHWHQYCDDAPTGRFDGENFQIGWVDVCDTPYPETIAAVRWVGDNMYGLRYGKSQVNDK